MVGATGSARSYQWRKNLGLISGGTSPSLSISPVGTGDAGSYDCVVTGTCGQAVSDAATLVVCAADYNCSGAVTVQDIFDFLAGWFANSPSADFNGSGSVTVQDIFDFLAAWFAGCP
jgi:hypothetical protein